jgi:hypothetical protein
MRGGMLLHVPCERIVVVVISIPIICIASQPCSGELERRVNLHQQPSSGGGIHGLCTATMATATVALCIERRSTSSEVRLI